ncbi:MAG: hypothetical protein JXR25_04940 [Pontiellaceae bacterium]|nr:hypothetical protein [Pontiellaceae bacterium]MBN2784153.1 hypothetical protein [Pontiellaceae bacterium]
MADCVFIPAAGLGTRLENKTKHLNKSLVTLAHRPILSHLIEQFPEDSEFVIALGYKGHLIKEFLSLAYPERSFQYVSVDPFEGPGSGLGWTMLCCREYLRRPFYFISSDTLVRQTIPPLNENWMGYAEVDELSQYRTLQLDGQHVSDICEKSTDTGSRHKAYIGLAAIKDWEAFWRAMESGGTTAIQTGEAYGMKALLGNNVAAYAFDWYDTGNLEALKKAESVYRATINPNILEKENEAIWFVNDTVIKFSADAEFIKGRVQRAIELDGFVPRTTGSTEFMYSCDLIDGDVMSKVADVPLLDKLLEYSKTFWTTAELSTEERTEFDAVCRKFYEKKTFDRVALFYKNFGQTDNAEIINGEVYPSLDELLNELDWGWISDGIACRFHGDFHFENIMVLPDGCTFKFLDWRQDFGGIKTVGDLYYDFAKLLHGMIVCHELIADDQYSATWDGNTVTFELARKPELIECEAYFCEWLGANGYDLKKVRVLTALIYLNIAALHHFPYSLMLYALGKTMLYNELRK